ncbi:MAG: sodium:alanine symporter family protein [Phycisphaerales bacterium]|nr:sodium:alanine symporter family protein [Phycisphaerales bacterium]
MDIFDFFNSINSILWHDYVLYSVLGVGVLFTLWSGFSQYRSITHGIQVVRGKYDDKNDPGAINHFQALSTALSGTVGLGNIAGVAVAVALGGPGAIFWMWIVGLCGMALKLTEVTQAMLYRDTSDPENPKGGAMWVTSRGFEKFGLKPLGVVIGFVFCITVIISTFTGGNMFQSWSVGQITKVYFPNFPEVGAGIILAVVAGLVIIGGIKRIGAVTGRLVPFMCVLYLLGAAVVLVLNVGAIPSALRLIVVSALPDWLGGQSADPVGAFLGGTWGYALYWGMKRALFSNEAGQGSSPIAHSAAKTDEPVREGVVAGLEPFIDTIVVCTITALVMIVSGAWNRESAADFGDLPAMVAVVDEAGQPVADQWVPSISAVPPKNAEAIRTSKVWRSGDGVFFLVHAEEDKRTGRDVHQVLGTINEDENSELWIDWTPFESANMPKPYDSGLYMNLPGPGLTGHAFDRAVPGMGMLIVTIAAWLFALSTIISWAYYGEQAVSFMLGKWAVLPYKLVYCLACVVATMGFIRTDRELDALTSLGTGVMLWANIPIMLIFGPQAMRAYRDYMGRLKRGELGGHAYPKATDVMEGKDIE